MALAFTLLPNPRKITQLEGKYSFQPDRLIQIDSPEPHRLVFTAGKFQKALQARLGMNWQVAAGWAMPKSDVGLALSVVPQLVMHPQGYRLEITPLGISLKGQDAAGVFYGICTLNQLLAQAQGQSLSCLVVEDWPDFPARGVMLDISRTKVPQMKTLYDLVDRLSAWKINQLQLYTEHTFAYRNHVDAWKDASPMTGEEILALDAFCKERFIELVPNQNSFGHLTRWLKLPRYAPLAEVTGEFDSAWGKMQGPFSLSPVNPGSLELVRSLYDELLPHFSSRMVNVGCDETIDLGAGQSKQWCEERGVKRVYLDFLLKIYEDISRRGFKMQFWGDIIVQAPELVQELPADSIALEWGYDADHPFDEHGRLFATSGIPFYVCPGTSSWNSIAGRTDNAIANLLSAAENGLKHGASGYLITDWGDNGHWQPLPVSYLGFAVGAAYAWNLENNRRLDVPEVLSRFAFEDPAGVMGKLAYDLGNVYLAPGIVLPNTSALFGVMQRSLEEIAAYPGISPAPFQHSLEVIDQAAACLGKDQSQGADAALIRREFALVVHMLRHACQRGLRAMEQDAHRKAVQSGLLGKDMDELLGEYRTIWLERNRPGGLAESLAYFKAYDE
jgi:hexosaminidase